MKNIFKNIKNWNSSLKLGSAIALGGVILVGTSIIYAANQPGKGPILSSVSIETSSTVTPPASSSSSQQPAVDEKVEEIIRPYTVQCDVAHYFYDETDAASIREKAIVSVPGANRTYMLSEGCDYTYNGADFDVVASVSGIVTEKLTDSTFGDILILTHESGTKFIYASLGDIKVNKGASVKQGDVLAKCGTSVYTSDLGKSLHFEITKDGENLNPEKIYSTSVENL